MTYLAGDVLPAGRIPGEWVIYQLISSDSSTFTTTETVVASVTADVIVGHTYWLIFSAGFEVASADSTMRLGIREDNVSGTVLINRDYRLFTGVAGTLQPVHVEVRYIADATESKTFVATGDLINGAGTANLNANSSNGHGYFIVAYQSP